MTATTTTQPNQKPKITIPPDKQLCPKCGFLIGALAGSIDAICKNCGFKDPCCE